MGVTFKIEGLKDTYEALNEIAEQIGDRKTRSKILIPAMRKSMAVTLSRAQDLAPKDTGALALLLQVEARRPNQRDRRSKYITQRDTVIAAVTTASGKKMAQMSTTKGIARARRRLKKMGVQNPDKLTGFTSDARAIAQEFGTAHNPSQPYLRPALESTAAMNVEELAAQIRKYIDKFKAKHFK